MGDAYPVFLRLEGRPCLVVGGGPVALRKVEGLLAGGGRVTVVAPEAVGDVEALARGGRVAWVRRRFEPSDLEGVVLALAATSDRGVNRKVAAEGAARGVWVNVADDAGVGDFHVPAVLRRGDLTVAVATGGASPALASWVRDRIGETLPEDLGEMVEVARSVRSGASDPEGRRARELFGSGILENPTRGEAKRKAEPPQPPPAEAR